MRITVVLPLVLAAGLVGHAFGQSLAKPFIVRISEGQTSTKPTAGPNNASNCLIVLPDGRLHLELRRQEFLNGRAVLTTYQSALDGKEIGILLRILDDTALRALQPFAQPVPPLNADDWQVFTAEIVRGSRMQQVGYFTWRGNGPSNPEADKAARKEASDKLQHLVEWSRSVKSSGPLNWRRVPNPKTACGQ
jgi:hypothetical protein